MAIDVHGASLRERRALLHAALTSATTALSLNHSVRTRLSSTRTKTRIWISQMAACGVRAWRWHRPCTTQVE